MKEVASYAQQIVDASAHLNGHTDDDWTILAAVRLVTTPWAAEFSKMFGEMVYGEPALATVLNKYSRTDREQAIAIWIERVVSGAPGESFWSETALIGMYHAAADIPNDWVLAFMSRLDSSFLANCIKSFAQPKALEVYGAFQRVLGVASALMVQSYERAVAAGVGQLGFSPEHVTQMRSVAVRKMIDESRSTLPVIVWDESLSNGVTEVDAQHKVLIDLLNLLHLSHAEGKGNETLKRVLFDLTHYTINHFAFEERLLEQYGYPELASHKESHDKLTRRVLEFKDAFDEGRSALGVELFIFLRSWLNGHIRGSDRHYGRYLNTKGVH